MTSPTALRSRLDARIAQAERLKLADTRPNAKSCTHPLVDYRQTVVPTNPRFQGSGAHFIVKACPLCRTKRVVNYVVERA